MLFHKTTPRARLAGWAFVALLVLFTGIYTTKPAIGMAGLGAVLILGSVLVEANANLIWETYRKAYKKQKPNPLYYKLNVFVLWPAMFLLGLASILAAYYVA